MIRTNSLYEACHELFVRYPLATRIVNSSGRIIHSMILILRDGDRAKFFVLSNDSGEDRPSYSLCPWRAAGIVNIEAEGGAVSDAMVNVVTCGVPIPLDGSLFGWIHEDAVTALITVSTSYAPTSPQPRWTVMPLAGIPEVQWPPFTGQHFFGAWFWEHYEAENLISLDRLIAAAPDTVFWADTTSILGSDSCAVARDTKSPKGHVLRSGCYVPYQALRRGDPLPPLEVILANPSKIDLAPRFRRAVHSNGWPQEEPETINMDHVV